MAQPKSPDWLTWLSLPRLHGREAIALTFNLDPQDVDLGTFSNGGQQWSTFTRNSLGLCDVKAISGFSIRLRLFESAFSRKGVTVSELAEWCAGQNWDSPSPILAMERFGAIHRDDCGNQFFWVHKIALARYQLEVMQQKFTAPHLRMKEPEFLSACEARSKYISDSETELLNHLQKASLVHTPGKSPLESVLPFFLIENHLGALGWDSAKIEKILFRPVRIQVSKAPPPPSQLPSGGFVRPPKKEEPPLDRPAQPKQPMPMPEPEPEKNNERERNSTLDIELYPLLENLKRQGSSIHAAKVMATLKGRTEDKTSCIFDTAADGILWRRADGMKEKLTVKALIKRIKRWENPEESKPKKTR